MMDLLDLLIEDPRGRTWLSGLDFGLINMHCSSQATGDVLVEADRLFRLACEVGHDADPGLAWASVELAMASTPVRTASDDGVAVHGVMGSYTHVTTSDAMEAYHFRGISQSASETLAWNLKTDNVERLEIFQKMFDSLIEAGKLLPKEKLTLGATRCWVSKTPLDAEGAFAATHYRDTRGLVHFTTENFLVAYQLDARHLPMPSRPAAIDGVGLRFRAWKDNPQSSDYWGTAVNLKKFAENDGTGIDGASEGLVPAGPMPSGLFQQVSLLGHPGVDDGISVRGVSENDDDKAFDDLIQSEALPLKVGYAQLVQRIREGGSP